MLYFVPRRVGVCYLWIFRVSFVLLSTRVHFLYTTVVATVVCRREVIYALHFDGSMIGSRGSSRGFLRSRYCRRCVRRHANPLQWNWATQNVFCSFLINISGQWQCRVWEYDIPPRSRFWADPWGWFAYFNTSCNKHFRTRTRLRPVKFCYNHVRVILLGTIYCCLLSPACITRRLLFDFDRRVKIDGSSRCAIFSLKGARASKLWSMRVYL